MASGGNTPNDASVAAIRLILSQDNFQPQRLRLYLKSLLAAARVSHRPEFLQLDDGTIISTAVIVAAMVRFNQLLPESRRIDDLDLDNPHQLAQLDQLIVESAGLAPSASPETTIPANLRELVREFETAHQVSLNSQLERGQISAQTLQDRIKQANAITIQMHQVRQAAIEQLTWAAGQSPYINDLAASLGVSPAVVRQLTNQRIEAVVDEAITAQTFRQARLISADPTRLAAMFVRDLRQLELDDVVGPALARNRRDQKQAEKKIVQLIKRETAATAAARKSAANDLAAHPLHRSVAQDIAADAIKQVEVAALGRTDSSIQLAPRQRQRLAAELARHTDNPTAQLAILKQVFSDATGDQLRTAAAALTAPARQLAASSSRPNPLGLANPNGILAEVYRHPERFQRSFGRAVGSGKFNSAETTARILAVSRILGISPDAVILHYGGVDAHQLSRFLLGSNSILGLPTQAPLSSRDPLIETLTRLVPEQAQLRQALNNYSLPPVTHQHFASQSARAARSVALENFARSVNPFRLFSAARYQVGHIQSLGSLAESGGSFISRLRTSWAPANAVFSGWGRISSGIRALPSLPLLPFRAAGNWIRHTLISPAGSWLKTQARAGLARAGAWLAKKGITAAAAKIGGALLTKGTAALLAQAVPVVGQIAGALVLLSSVGDIAKFIWQQREPIAKAGLGLVIASQMLVSSLLGALQTAGWTLAGAMIGWALGGWAGAVIGGSMAWLISSGTLGAIITGVGGWLGGALSALGSFIGTITAPAALSGVASTVATVSVISAVGGGAYLAIQNQHAQTAALYVQTAAPGSYTLGPGADVPACWPTSGQITQGPYNDRPLTCYDGSGQRTRCSHDAYNSNAIDIARSPVGEPVYASHDGTATAFASSPVAEYGNYVIVTSAQGFLTIYAHLLQTDLPSGVPTPITGGTRIGLMGSTGNSSGPHLHYELNNDGHIDTIVPPYNLYDTVSYDPGCIGQASSQPSGWMARTTGTANVIATTNTEYDAAGGEGQNACTWLESHSEAAVAANANFFDVRGTRKTPRGPASFRLDPIPHSLDPRYDFWSIYAGSSGFTLGLADIATRPHQFAVSGTPLLMRGGITQPIPDTSVGPQHFIWHTKDIRVAMGYTGATAVIAVLNNATVKDMQTFLLSKNIQNAINLDGGSSAALCERTGSGIRSIITTGRKSANSIGLIGGTIEQITGNPSPTP